ncbi:mannan-binding lectin serine protease 1 isoform X2 [Astyanax mexicanus]|uniref:mannan-binding lectin serine protease 1 isoform X2 n=1 Tax=Astyanax mexicanus TaxID=7994 RepID=UPI0020CB0E95|nr:mannan-binding lectin serine protease 1 isoform X2 [Astyanax mexicanus]
MGVNSGLFCVLLPALFSWLCVSVVGANIVLLNGSMYGSIQSPNFPEPYPKESEVQWNISVPDGHQIRLYFMHFDIEPSYLCEYDYVKLCSETEELAVFCGRESTDTERVPADDIIYSPGSTLSVAFHSDFSNEERYSGFEAHYSAVDIDECRDRNDEDLACDHFCHNYIGGYYCSCRYGYQLHSDNRTCKVECSDSVYTERSGQFTSADFPKPYPKSSDCLYRIELEDGFLVTLDFDDSFDIEDHPEVTCPYDHIKIQAGEREFGPFCGDRSPGRIQTGSNIVSILFHSDNSGENLGWKLTYTATGSECPVPVVPLNGHFESLQSQYFFKEHITVTCDPGYSLQKDGEEFEHYQLECQTDGTWSSSLPLCKMVDCGLVNVSVGEVVYQNSSNSTMFGSSIIFSCRSSPTENSMAKFHKFHIILYFLFCPFWSSQCLLCVCVCVCVFNEGTYTCAQTGLWVREDGATLPSCQTDVGNATQPQPEPQQLSPTARTQPACGESTRPFPSQQKRIVGGRTAPPGLFPWQVLLTVEDTYRVPEVQRFGSGALLSPSWVITAAHVLRSQRRDSSIVPVAAEHVHTTLGLTNIREKHLGVNRSVERLILHPRFNPRNYDNDIALIRLSQEVALNQLVRPVCLPPPWVRGHAPTPVTNMLGVVAGWGINAANTSDSNSGLTSDPGAMSEVLQYVKLPVVAQDECEASYASRSVVYNITDNMFCAGFFEGGQDTCLGDSGGAFVTEDPHSGRWVVHGLVSWGGPEECGSQRVYGVYTRVANYARWLHTQMDTDSAQVVREGGAE